MFIPKIKSFERIVDTAAMMFGGVDLCPAEQDTAFKTARKEIRLSFMGKLKNLKLTKLDIVVYVNWASWNCLTQDDLASELNLSRDQIKRSLAKTREVFPHLFLLGQTRDTASQRVTLPT